MSHTTYHLYHYWRSSASWRARMALMWKNIPFITTHVGLLNGESESAEHLRRNPAGYVPVLELTSGPHAGTYITESLAMIRYLEEVHPEAPTLFPGTALDHAHIWSLAETINAGTQPMINLNVIAEHSENPEIQKKWMQHWIHRGLETYELLAKKSSGKFSHGDHFSLADVCLIPQLYAADRNQVSLNPFPTIQKVQANCKLLAAVTQSHPDHFQPAES